MLSLITSIAPVNELLSWSTRSKAQTFSFPLLFVQQQSDQMQFGQDDHLLKKQIFVIAFPIGNAYAHLGKFSTLYFALKHW